MELDNGNCRFHCYQPKWRESSHITSLSSSSLGVDRTFRGAENDNFLLSPPLYLSLLPFTFSPHSLKPHSNLALVSTSTLDMATSSSTCPPSSLGECVVCGRESSTRCSKCAQGGVNWMYFCSQEHQKLVSRAFQ